MTNADPPLPSLKERHLPLWLRVVQIAFTALPISLRGCIYEYIFRIRMPSATTRGVLRLPFGLALKMSEPPLLPNEFEALKFVRKLKGINHPVLFDSIPTTIKDCGFMITTWIEGDMAGDIWDDLTIEDKQRMTHDLRDQLGALRQQNKCSNHIICCATGGPVLDYRIPWIEYESPGPRSFDDPRKFAAEVWPGMDQEDVPYRVALRPVMKPVIDRVDVPISFCHGDLQLKNIIFEGGLASWRSGRSRLALIDWEHAGWMPVYWDAVKATWMEDEPDSNYLLMFRQIYPDAQIHEALNADWEWRYRANIPIV